MKRLLITLSLVALCAIGLRSQEKTLTFIQISDPQLGFFDKNQSISADSTNLAVAIEAVNRLKPDFLVCTGDMVNAGTSKKQLAAYRNLISKVNKDIPVWHVPGNHDIGKGAEDRRIELYESQYGYSRFVFSKGGCTFIGINSCIIKEHNEPSEQEQYKWLKRQLRKASKNHNVYIFTHYPFFTKDYTEKETYSNQSASVRERYWSLFKEYGVKAVLAGHLHSTKDTSSDGIRMYTCGPVGKPLGKGYSGAAVWTLSDGGRTASVRYLSLEELSTLEKL